MVAEDIKMKTNDVICDDEREHFDYTEWQRTLWNDLTIDEVYQLAVDREKTQENNG